MTQSSAPPDNTLPKGELFLKLQSEKTADGEEDNTHYLKEDQKWLADAGVEKIEWELWHHETDAKNLVFSVQVKIKDEKWEKRKNKEGNVEENNDPWENVNCNINNLYYKDAEEKRRVVPFVMFSSKDNKKYPSNNDIKKITTEIKDKSFWINLTLKNPSSVDEAGVWRKDDKLTLYFGKHQSNINATIVMNVPGLNDAIDNFYKNLSSSKIESKQTPLAGQPAETGDTRLLIDKKTEEEAKEPISTLPLKKENDESKAQPRQIISAQKDLQQPATPGMQVGLAPDAENKNMEDPKEVNPPEKKEVGQKEDSSGNDNIGKTPDAVPEPPAGQPGNPSTQPFVLDEARLKTYVYEAVSSILLQDKSFKESLINKLAETLANSQAQSILPQGEKLKELLNKAISEEAAHKIGSKNTLEIDNILTKAARELLEKKLEGIAAEGKQLDELLQKVLKGALIGKIETAISSNSNIDEHIDTILNRIISDRIKNIYPDESSLEAVVEKIIKNIGKSELDATFKNMLEELSNGIKEKNQEEINKLNKSIEALTFRLDDMSSFAMPDWDGIEREMIRKCLDLGDDDSSDGLESWLTEITYNLASELLPRDYVSHQNIQKDINKLLDPLFARRHEHLSLFATTASKIVADNKLKTSRNPLGKSFVKKAKQAFKNEPANGEKDPLDNLPNPFVDGWQTVVARLKEARKYKSREGLLSLEEIRQQFARKEIFELIYNNRNSIYELHKKAPEDCRKSDEELDDVFKRIEEFAGLERIAPVPGQALFDERLHWPADEISNKLIAPNQITSVDQIGYRLKSTGEVLGKAKVVVNRRSS